MLKILKVLGVIVFVCILLIGGMFYWAAHETHQVKAEVTPFLKKSVPLIATWDVANFEHLFTAEGKENIQSEQGLKVINYLSKLGALKAFEEPTFIKSTSSVTTKTGSSDVAIFIVQAQFENGGGLFTFTLMRTDSGYLIQAVNLNSEYFLEL